MECSPNGIEFVPTLNRQVTSAVNARQQEVQCSGSTSVDRLICSRLTRCVAMIAAELEEDVANQYTGESGQPGIRVKA